MDAVRKMLAALAVVALMLTTAACSAEADLNEEGAGVKVEGEGEGGEGGEGGD